MKKLMLLVLLGVGALVAYNHQTGRDLFQLPGSPAAAITDTVRDAVKGTVRETVRDTRDSVKETVRETRDEVQEYAKEGLQTARQRGGDAVAAATLTSKIKAKMALDDVVQASNINVDTEGGVVTLTGDVASAAERTRAVRIATETAGVTKVVNRLKVRD